jgi:two-component system sensor histidine kinase/response regulator
MRKRVPILVATGFALLIVLGLGVSLSLFRALHGHVQAENEIQVLGENVRASVRDLRAHYLERAQQVSTALVDPEPGTRFAEQSAKKARIDEKADRNLERALAVTRDAELRRVLRELRAHDHLVTDRLEDEVLQLCKADPAAARRLYLSEYLPAQQENMALVDRALSFSIKEMHALDQKTDTGAAQTEAWSRPLIGLFFALGAVGAVVLTGFIARMLRKAEEAARDNKDMMEQSLDVICSIDEEQRFVCVSAACEKIWGYSPAELEGRRHISLVHPDDVEKTNAVAAQIMAGHPAKDFENRYVRKDSGVVNMMWSARWVEEQKQMFCVARDVTERNRADEELKHSEERLAASQRMAHVGSWEWSVVTNEIIWSDEEYRLFGLEPGERKASYDLYLSCVHPDARADAVKWVNAVLATKKSSRLDVLIVRPDGEERILSSWADVVLDEAGNVVRVVGTSQDVTERKLDEEARQRLAGIVEFSDDAIISKTLDGKIVSWNGAAEKLYGYTAEEAIGARVKMLVPPDRFNEEPEILERIKRGELVDHYESVRMRKDGRLVDVSLTISPVKDTSGKIIGASKIARDITQQKQAERELVQAHDLAMQSTRMKSEFLANMSHEIRTPMNGIIGMTDLALETDLNRDQREYLGIVKSSAHSLLGLINDILDFSKIEAGKLELDSIDFSLRDCIGGMLKPLGIRADQKGLELVADIPSDVPDHLVGDPMRLRQILINLTDNAIKFTERGEVIVKVINQSAPNGESHLHFCVADTGIGIPAEKQGAIFEAFAQADGSTTRTYGGTGLGLSISSQLIRKMHGRIWIESKVGEGTTFHFTARLGVRYTPSPSVKHADPRDLEGLRALVVDDNAVNRRILQDMLVNWRMRPMVVESGALAVEEMMRAAQADTAYQLVLLDAMMPDMDGFALAEKIHQQPALSGATVMMLSSAMPGGTTERCGALGIAGWLTKPVAQSELLDAILIAVSKDSAMPVTNKPETGFTETQPSKPGLRILVAEDNVVNRAVATGILERQGHVLVHAANGQEAITALNSTSFDLILMDVQMPVMDGFQATRRIREMEATTECHVPIVAMTAHAMAGDRERCLAAGMDDYVAKPLRKEDVLRVLEHCSYASASHVPEPPTEPLLHGTEPPLSLYSREELLEQCDGDDELMGRLIALFHENTPRLLDDIRDSIARRGSSDLARSAHALLSSLGAFGANDARHLTRQLETQAHHEDYEDTDRTFAALERGTAEIYLALAAFNPARA